MNHKFKSLKTFCVITFILLSFFRVSGTGQSTKQSAQVERVKECFDFNWLFHNGNIAMKHVVQAGCQGGLTDVNVRVITAKDTILDYNNVKSAEVFETW